MARLDVGRVTLSLYLVPAAAILISLAWLGQAPGPVELAGGAVALAGVILAGRWAGPSRVAAGDQHRGQVQVGVLQRGPAGTSARRCTGTASCGPATRTSGCAG